MVWLSNQFKNHSKLVEIVILLHEVSEFKHDDCFHDIGEGMLTDIIREWPANVVLNMDETRQLGKAAETKHLMKHDACIAVFFRIFASKFQSLLGECTEVVRSKFAGKTITIHNVPTIDCVQRIQQPQDQWIYVSHSHVGDAFTFTFSADGVVTVATSCYNYASPLATYQLGAYLNHNQNPHQYKVSHTNFLYILPYDNLPNML